MARYRSSDILTLCRAAGTDIGAGVGEEADAFERLIESQPIARVRPRQDQDVGPWAGNSVKGFEDIHLKNKAILWP